MSSSEPNTTNENPGKDFGLSTAGFRGQPGHYYARGREPFINDDPCIYGCGAEMSWNGADAPAGIDPYAGCPKNPEWPAYLARMKKNLKESRSKRNLQCIV